MSESPAPDEPPRGSPGRPAWKPTPAQRQTALMLYGLGATDAQVAAQLGVAKITVQKHLTKERDEGWGWANLQLYGALWKKGVKSGNVAALIFLAKNRLGMSDRQEVQHSGDAAGPPARQELCLRVEFAYPTDPRALQPPPAERLPQFKGPE